MVTFELEGVPPSVNHAYVNLRGGGRTLSVEGKRFKNETAVYLARKYPAELKYLKPNVPYGIRITLCMPNLLNATWPEKATSRYKKIDVSNRIKLLEDVLVSATGIDDSQFMQVTASKVKSEKERTIIEVLELPLEPYA